MLTAREAALPQAEPWLKDSYDVCVIGSGPGGAVTAATLAEAGWKVALVERGPFFGVTLVLELKRTLSTHQPILRTIFGITQDCSLGRDPSFSSNVYKRRPDGRDESTGARTVA
ncbi:MAG: FAD-dependent oxidoreductase [Blastocatellia bacterium]